MLTVTWHARVCEVSVQPAALPRSAKIALRMTLEHFANARSVRNALDRSRLRQANRLFANASKTDLMTLEAEDILAGRVFVEGKLDMDGDEGSDSLDD